MLCNIFAQFKSSELCCWFILSRLGKQLFGVQISVLKVCTYCNRLRLHLFWKTYFKSKPISSFSLNCFLYCCYTFSWFAVTPQSLMFKINYVVLCGFLQLEVSHLDITQKSLKTSGVHMNRKVSIALNLTTQGISFPTTNGHLVEPISRKLWQHR